MSLHQFQVVSGIVRCADTACQITQCWKCEREQNKIKKAERKQKNSAAAAVIQTAEQDALCDQARERLAAGWVPDFTEPEPASPSKQELYADMDKRRMAYISERRAEVAAVVYPSLPVTFDGCNINLLKEIVSILVTAVQSTEAACTNEYQMPVFRKMHAFMQELKQFVGSCDGLRSYQVSFKTNYAKALEKIGGWIDVMLELTPSSLINDIQRTKDFLSKVEHDFDQMVRADKAKRNAAGGDHDQIQLQKQFIATLHAQFDFVPIKADGDCVFGSLAYVASKISGQDINSVAMRKIIGDHIVQKQGHIPLYLAGELVGSDQYLALDKNRREISGRIRFEIMRGCAEVDLSVAEFAVALLQGHKKRVVYGGDECFAAFVDLYQTPLCRYGTYTREPEVFGVASGQAPEHFILWTVGKSKAEDHCDILIPKTSDDPAALESPRNRYEKHERMMRQALSWKWGVDLYIRFISEEKGRGIFAGRDFEVDDVLGWYDGHRCDPSGQLVFARAAVAMLFEKYPHLNREETGEPIIRTHCLQLNRSAESGVVIDGHPLTHPCLDEEPNIGRFALANSANPESCNMKMICVPAPDIAPDKIMRLLDLEHFLVARVRIRCVYYHATLTRSHAHTLARSHARTLARSHARTLARSHARTLTRSHALAARATS